MINHFTFKCTDDNKEDAQIIQILSIQKNKSRFIKQCILNNYNVKPSSSEISEIKELLLKILNDKEAITPKGYENDDIIKDHDMKSGLNNQEALDVNTTTQPTETTDFIDVEAAEDNLENEDTEMKNNILNCMSQFINL